MENNLLLLSTTERAHTYMGRGTHTSSVIMIKIRENEIDFPRVVERRKL